MSAGLEAPGLTCQHVKIRKPSLQADGRGPFGPFVRVRAPKAPSTGPGQAAQPRRAEIEPQLISAHLSSVWTRVHTCTRKLGGCKSRLHAGRLHLKAAGSDWMFGATACSNHNCMNTWSQASCYGRRKQKSSLPNPSARLPLLPQATLHVEAAGGCRFCLAQKCFQL